MKTCQRRVITSWIAILAILLNALMPTVSMAMESSRGKSIASSNDWIEVCTTQGSIWVHLDSLGRLIEQSDKKPADAPASLHAEHCPYCLTHAASFGLPPQSVMVLAVWPPVADLLPQVDLQVHKRLVWLMPAARAPPTPA